MKKTNTFFAAIIIIFLSLFVFLSSGLMAQDVGEWDVDFDEKEENIKDSWNAGVSFHGSYGVNPGLEYSFGMDFLIRSGNASGFIFSLDYTRRNIETFSSWGPGSLEKQSFLNVMSGYRGYINIFYLEGGIYNGFLLEGYNRNGFLELGFYARTGIAIPLSDFTSFDLGVKYKYSIYSTYGSNDESGDNHLNWLHSISIQAGVTFRG